MLTSGACGARTCRCLQTATLALDGLTLAEMNVEENVRETLGEDTCDARRCGAGHGWLERVERALRAGCARRVGAHMLHDACCLAGMAL